MKTCYLVLCGSLLLAASAAAAEKNNNDWKSIFDGKTLNGWKANERPEDWKVVDGAIEGKGPRSHLFYVAEEFKNFEFKATVWTEPGSNSGIFFHTKFQKKRLARARL